MKKNSDEESLILNREKSTSSSIIEVPEENIVPKKSSFPEVTEKKQKDPNRSVRFDIPCEDTVINHDSGIESDHVMSTDCDSDDNLHPILKKPPVKIGRMRIKRKKSVPRLFPVHHQRNQYQMNGYTVMVTAYV